GQLPMSVWMVLVVTILGPISFGQGFTVEQFFLLLGAVDLHESFYKLAIFPATARTVWIVFVPVDLHGEKACHHSERCRQVRLSTWYIRSLHTGLVFRARAICFGRLRDLDQLSGRGHESTSIAFPFKPLPSLNGFDDEPASQERFL